MKKILLYFNQCLGGNKIPSKTRREIRQEWKAKKAAKNLQNPSVDAINLDGKSQNDEVEAVSPASPTTKLGPGAVVVQPLSAKAKSAPALGEGNLENLNNNNNNSSNIPSIDQQLAVNNSIARLQALVRRFLTTRRFIHHWQSALQEADDYWLEIYWKKEEDRRKKMLAAKARKQFTMQYVGDVIGTSVLYILQTAEACKTIQRTWRGHYCRMRLPKKPPPPKMRPKPRALRPRFGADVLRRVWARSEFEPAGQSYLHATDFGYLEYNIWEHVENPPEGHESGLITRKVKLPVINSKDEFVIKHDKHAWVGLPIGFESHEERQERETAMRSNAVKNLHHYSPYAIPLLTEEERRNGVKSRKPTGKVEERKEISGLELLESFGYDQAVEEYFRLPGMPRIGTKRYEPSTGHLIVYKGNNRWVRVLTGEDVVLVDKLADERLSISKFNSVVSNAKESILVPPSIFEMKSGMISVNNPSLEEKSSFSRSHKLNFDKSYTHTSDGEYENDDDEDDFRVRKEDSMSDYGSTTDSTVTPIKQANKKESVSLLTGWTVLGDSYVAVQKRKCKSTPQRIPVEQQGISWQKVREGVKELSYRLNSSRERSSRVMNEASRMDTISIKSEWHPKTDTGDKMSAQQYLNYEISESFDETAAVWSRSIYQPKKKIIPKVVVWPKKAPEHYSLKFTWIPQPLVHNAVNNIYYEKTYRDFHKGSIELFSRYFHDEVQNSSERNQIRARQSSLIQLVSGGDSKIMEPVQPDALSTSKSSRSSSHPLHYFYDDGDESSIGSSFEPDSTRHPLRGKSIEIVADRKQGKNEDDGGTFLSSMTSYDQISGPGRKRHTMMPLSYDLEASTVIDHAEEEEEEGGLFLTSLGGNQVKGPSATLQHSNTRVSLPPPRNFDEYIRTTKPAQLVRAQSALVSSSNNALLDGKQMSKKFKYRPPLSKTIGAKITPMHPYEWH